MFGREADFSFLAVLGWAAAAAAAVAADDLHPPPTQVASLSHHSSPALHLNSTALLPAINNATIDFGLESVV